MFNGNWEKMLELNLENPETNIEKLMAYDRELYQLSDKVITVTKYMKEFLIETYKIDSNIITVIPNGIDIPKNKKLLNQEKAKIKREWGFNQRDIIILFAGRVDTGKGVHFLLDAFIEACKERSDLRLVIAGGGNLKNVIRNIKIFQGRILFTELITKEKLEELYLISDIGILPSLYEQCPYSLLEMMTHKLPVILTKIDGIKEIYNDEHCIYIEPITDDHGNLSLPVNCIKEAILNLARNKKQATQMGKKAFKELSDKFSSKRMAKSYIKFISSSK